MSERCRSRERCASVTVVYGFELVHAFHKQRICDGAIYKGKRESVRGRLGEDGCVYVWGEEEGFGGEYAVRSPTRPLFHIAVSSFHHIQTHTSAHLRTHTCISTPTRTYTHTHTHTHIHTHTRSRTTHTLNTGSHFAKLHAHLSTKLILHMTT